MIIALDPVRRRICKSNSRAGFLEYAHKSKFRFAHRRIERCGTCRLNYFQCPGHFGHIELASLVHHPLFMTNMFAALRATCLFCHRFKLSRGQVSIPTLRINCTALLSLFSKYSSLLPAICIKENQVHCEATTIRTRSSRSRSNTRSHVCRSAFNDGETIRYHRGGR